MTTWPTALLFVHVVGLALGVGAATVKLALLVGAARDEERLVAFLEVARPITRLIIVGLVLLTASGAGWLLLGRPLTALLAAKLALVIGVWALGPVIDKLVEPRFRSLAPPRGAAPSPEFRAARRRFIAVEAVATGLFYGATSLGVLL